MFFSGICAATILCQFESDRQQCLFLPLFLSPRLHQTILHITTTYVCSIVCYKVCMMIEKREKRSQIRKRVCRGRVRAFNLPIRSLGRYPYTTGSEGICGRILLNILGLEAQKCSETVFTTSKQRTAL